MPGGTPNKKGYCGRPQPCALWAKYYLAYGHAVCNIIFLPAEFPAYAGVILLCFVFCRLSRMRGVLTEIQIAARLNLGQWVSKDAEQSSLKF
ncbi:hypothetical protein HMPREF1631_00475 [Arcanobacterium sp. S3PF19]|nr:hypothetical protein HMPREF1631_00475 [Arcanobacterium sp. S3PF19]